MATTTNVSNGSSYTTDGVDPWGRAFGALFDYAAEKDYASNIGKLGSSMAGKADPFGPYRPGFASYLNSVYNDPSQFAATNPAYAFNLQQGLQQIDRTSAASGKFFSGNRALALQDYAQNMASNEYDKELQRLALYSGANQSPYQAAALQSQFAEQAAMGALRRSGAAGAGTGAIIDALFGSSGNNGGSTPLINSLLSQLISGGGTDGVGNRGLLGDIGGWLSGSYGQTSPSYNYGYEIDPSLYDVPYDGYLSNLNSYDALNNVDYNYQGEFSDLYNEYVYKPNIDASL